MKGHMAGTAFTDVTAGGDTFVIRVQHHLEQDGRIIGRAARGVTAQMLGKPGQIKFVFDQVVNRVLDGTGNDVVIE